MIQLIQPMNIRIVIQIALYSGSRFTLLAHTLFIKRGQILDIQTIGFWLAKTHT